MTRATSDRAAISVAATKKRRGRPKAFSWLGEDPQAKVLAAILTDGASRRVALHRFYALEAASAIRGEKPAEHNPRYSWFDGPSPRFGVMVELGRVAVELGYDNARRLADILAQDLANMNPPPTTREVERWLRHERLKAKGLK